MKAVVSYFLPRWILWMLLKINNHAPNGDGTCRAIVCYVRMPRRHNEVISFDRAECRASALSNTF